MKKLVSYLIVILPCLMVPSFSLSQVKVLATAKSHIDKGQYQQAIPLLFRSGYTNTKGLKPDQIQLARLWLGISLQKVRLNQLASFPLIGVTYQGTPAQTEKALQTLLKITDVVKDQSLLNYTISKLDVKLKSNTKDELLFQKLGESYMDSNRMDKAEQAFASSLSVNPQNKYSLYQLGLIKLKTNNPSQAYQYFEKLYNLYADLPDNNPAKTQSMLALARTFYQAKKWDQAAELYRYIPKDNPEYRQSQFELAWTLFRTYKFRGALSTIETLQTPYYETYFDPDSLILRMIILLFICQVDDLERSLQAYEKGYYDIGKIVKSWLSIPRTPNDYLNLVNQANVNLKLIQNGYEEKYKTDLPFFVLRAGLEDPKVQPHLDSVKKIQAESKRFQKSNLAKIGGLKRYADKVYANRLNSAKKRLAQGFKVYIDEVVNRMADYNGQVGLIKYEILNTKKTQLRQNLGKTEEERKGVEINQKRDYYSENGYRYWPFQGEFWIDEVGNYQYLGGNRCENE